MGSSLPVQRGKGLKGKVIIIKTIEKETETRGAKKNEEGEGKEVGPVKEVRHEQKTTRGSTSGDHYSFPDQK